jgi:hypothetical protein
MTSRPRHPKPEGEALIQVVEEAGSTPPAAQHRAGNSSNEKHHNASSNNPTLTAPSRQSDAPSEPMRDDKRFGRDGRPSKQP